MSYPDSRDIWARGMGNDPVEVMASGLKIASGFSNIMVNYGKSGMIVQSIVANYSGSIICGVYGCNEDGAYPWVLVSGSAYVTGSNVIKIHSNLTAATNVGKDLIPRYWRVKLVHAANASGSYSITGYPVG
jgi:hypothetical protein